MSSPDWQVEMPDRCSWTDCVTHRPPEERLGRWYETFYPWFDTTVGKWRCTSCGRIVAQEE